MLFCLTNGVCFGQLTDLQIEDFIDRCEIIRKPETSDGIKAIEQAINERYQFMVQPKEPTKREPKKSNARTNALRIRENKENEAKAKKDYDAALEEYNAKLELKKRTENEVSEMRDEIKKRKEILAGGKDLIAGPLMSLTSPRDGAIGFLALNKGNPPVFLNLEFNRKWRGMSSASEFYIHRTLNRLVIHGLDATSQVNKTVYQVTVPLVSMKPTDDQNLLQFRVATRKEVDQLIDAVQKRFDAEMPVLNSSLVFYDAQKVSD